MIRSAAHSIDFLEGYDSLAGMSIRRKAHLCRKCALWEKPLFIGMGSCTNDEGNRSSNDGLAMDSASMAERAKDELTLLILKKKKQAAERNANQAASNTKEAMRIERDAMDAARQADDAFRTEEKAQKARQEADDQAEKAENARDKANEN